MFTATDDPVMSSPELTRHFVATVYVVHDGAALLHEHERLGMWLPPGGHVDRDELPRVTARREVAEETGLDVTLLSSGPSDPVESETAEELTGPEHLLLEDIVVTDGHPVHQHVDFVYYGVASDRSLDTAPGEAPASAWEWFDADALQSFADLPEDVRELGLEAIERVSGL
jgi:8-oxo-dGTP pyrophosphatase MutT (NUDIX family)